MTTAGRINAKTSDEFEVSLYVSKQDTDLQVAELLERGMDAVLNPVCAELKKRDTERFVTITVKSSAWIYR